MTQLTFKYFDVKKAGQLVFYFLSKASMSRNNITKLRLVKWIYLAERSSYREFGEPMIGDRLCSMQHGPAPSETVALLENKNFKYREDPFHDIVYTIKEKGRPYMALAANCPYSSIDDLDRFSEAEIELLDLIWEKYGNWSAGDLETHLHDRSLFPEWNWKAGDGTNWTDLETILKVVGFDDDDIAPMVENILAFFPVNNTQSSVQ